MSLIPTPDLALLPAADPDCGVLGDRRLGFSLILPGCPTLGEVKTAPGSEPSLEATVTFAELPIVLQLRVHKPPAARDPRSLLEGFIRTYTASRTPSLAKIRNIEAEQLSRWRVEAAASTQYKLSMRMSHNGESEDLLVLCRQGQLLTLTRRFVAERLVPLSGTLFTAALYGTLSWDGAPPPVAPRLWPESRFLGAGISGRLTAACRPLAERLSPIFEMDADDAAALGVRIEPLIAGHDAPATALGSDAILQVTHRLTQVCPRPPQEDAITELLRDVRTAHDLRGVALLLLHILKRQPAAFAD
jgi:hypothetical protein